MTVLEKRYATTVGNRATRKIDVLKGNGILRIVPIGKKESGKRGEGNDGRRSSLPNTKIASTESESESGPVEVKHIKQNNIWTAPCVTAASPRLREAVTLMIDTGADINLIKIKKLAKRTIINTKRIVQLTGITPDTQKTLGTVELIIFGEKSTFHAVDNHFSISADGIIGNEFLCSTPTNIDYIREVLIVKNRRVPFTVGDKVGIPPRTSKVIFCHVINADVKDGYIPRIQLPMGVYAGEALVGNVDGKAYFGLINTTSRFVSLQIPKMKLLAYNIETLSSLPDYDNTMVFQCRVEIDKRFNMDRIRTKDKHDRATVEQVMDARTKMILFKFLNQGIIGEINGCISTEKEANVYHAISKTGNEFAIKIYKTSILRFKDRDKYVTGEFRFRHGYCRHNPRKMVRTWAKKEVRN
ncbi:hypothetical protein M0804_013505 [Polistes exclamans]|nr:hypothetical protein M0804_013505 [Polistes exclamans]